MILRSRSITILLMVLAMVVAALVWFQTSGSESVIIQEQVGSASIYFAADRDRLVFPGECVVARWDVQSIKEVYLNGRGRVGSGQQEICLMGQLPTLRVVFLDDSSREFRLPVQRLYETPLNALLLLSLGLLVSVAAYRWLGAPAVAFFLTIVLLWPLMRVEVNQGSDMIDHLFFAQSAWDAQNFARLPPHFLYHILLIGLQQLFPVLNVENAGFIVIMTCYGVSSLVTYYLVRWRVGEPSPPSRRNLLFAVAAISLLFVNAITLDSSSGSILRDGFINPNPYHSPTMIVMRPFALLLFGGIIWVMDSPEQVKIKHSIGLGIGTILGTLAKPSYTVALLPALMVVLVYRFIRRRRMGSDYRLALVFIAAVLVLIWQYRYLYDTQSASTFASGYTSGVPQIAFSPFELLTVWWGVPWAWIIPQLLLSIAFPLAVYAAYFRQAQADLALNLAWLSLVVGVFITYLLVEIPGQSNGNLTWSRQIALLILFTVSAGFLLRQPLRGSRWRDNWRFIACSLIFLAHVLNGLVKLY